VPLPSEEDARREVQRSADLGPSQNKDHHGKLFSIPPFPTTLPSNLTRPNRHVPTQSFILSGMSAIVSQLATNGGKFTPEVLQTACQMAALSCPPYSHFWYPILDMISSNPIIKTIIDQLFWRPLIIAYTFVLMNLLKVRPFYLLLLLLLLTV
jgi:hypothetical protein